MTAFKYFVGIRNEMVVLASLQKPRKITLIGTDGRPYDILCKPKDDLRRDARLMEFNNIVNMYLHRDPESRARSLHIRTYVSFFTFTTFMVGTYTPCALVKTLQVPKKGAKNSLCTYTTHGLGSDDSSYDFNNISHR